MLALLRRLGRVEYPDALRMQAQLVAMRQDARIPNQLLVVEHPHSITLGRRAKNEHILVTEAMQRQFDIDIHESVRGGDVTYHGPGQIVFYPILGLPPKRQDVVRYVRDLEEVMIRALAAFGVDSRRIPGLSGVWVGKNGSEDKIGAIGVRMSRWVSSHGFALNANTDLRYFEFIVPCGIQDHGVTSLQKILGQKVDEKRLSDVLIQKFSEVFECRTEERDVDLESIQTIVYRRSPHFQILCLKRREGDFWQPVTGRIERGETPLEAAGREVLEETGIHGTPKALDYVHGFMLDPELFHPPRFPRPTFVREHSFALEVEGDPPLRRDPATHDAIEWFAFDDAFSKQKWPGHRVALKKLYKRLNASAG